VLLARQEHLDELDRANNDGGMAAILYGRHPKRIKDRREEQRGLEMRPFLAF
jgi:hypothetical protein